MYPTHKLSFHSIQKLKFRSAAGRVTRVPCARWRGQEIPPERLATLGPTQFPIQWVPDVFPAGVNWPKIAADHSPQFKAGFKGDWSHIYTGCPRRNVKYFGRVFLMLNYTDITQNTYIQSWTVAEIMAREKCGHLAFPRTLRLQL